MTQLTGSELELPASDETMVDQYAQLSLVTPEKSAAKTPDQKSSQLIRQYVPSDAIQLDDDLATFNNPKSQTLLDSFKLDHGPALPRSNATIDLLLTIFCFATVHFMYLGSLDLSSHRTIALFSSLLLIILCLSAGGIYSTKRLKSLNSELTILLLCCTCAFAAVGLFAFLSKTAAEVSRVWITSSMMLALASLASVRVLGALGLVAGKKVRTRRVIICGNTPNIKPVLNNLHKHSHTRVHVAKIFEFSTQSSVDTGSMDSLDSPAEQIVRFVEYQRQSGQAVEQVWIAVEPHQSHIVEQLSETLINSSVDVCVVPDIYTERLLKGEINRFGETKLVNISEISLSPAADQFKRVCDAFLASIALLLFCIPMVIIACLIKLETPGAVLFRQKRYGVDGTEIEILKFRSMKVHTDNQTRQAVRNDARVTRLGKFLRSTSLDELPQLLNVLSGSMSLIGPRPHAVSHNESWRSQINGYMLRHKVRPGITGWAQVNGWRGETDTVYKMQQRVKYDLEYIQNWSPWLDIKILFLTVLKGFRNENAF